MELTEDRIIEKHAKQSGHRSRITLLPFEYEFTCISCGFNLIKRKHELTKIRREEVNFINRLKYAELKIFCICVDVYKTYEGIEFDKIYKVLSTLENKEIKLNKILIKKYKDVLA